MVYEACLFQYIQPLQRGSCIEFCFLLVYIQTWLFYSNLQKLPDNFAIGAGDFVNHFVVISINK